MGRIRTIKPEFFRHEGLFEAEVRSGLPLRLAFAGLWTVADREGRFRWRPRQLKLDVLPYDDVDISAVLDTLKSEAFIVDYIVDGEQFGWIPTWHRHQVINGRESQSKLPAPPVHDASPDGAARDADATATREARVSHASGTPHRHAQGEREGEREGNSVPGGTGAVAPVADPAPMHAPAKSPAELTKAELWTAGKSLLREQGMPEAQCGTFVGKLVKDYGDDTVIDVVRSAVVERPADVASWLVKACKTRGAPRKRGQLTAEQQRDESVAKAARIRAMLERDGDPLMPAAGLVERVQ